MLSVELIDDFSSWKKSDDLIDLKARVQMTFNGTPLPEKYFPNGIEVNLYETTFELLDLLSKVALKNEQGSKTSAQAELCYTGNFLEVHVDSQDTFVVTFKFNPAMVDDERLLANDQGDYRVAIPLKTLGGEILLFAISVYEAILDSNPLLEESLMDLQATIFDHQERVEKMIRSPLFPPSEE
nr:hypothetical protein [Candidatus Sigynarchaeota archaeon]